MPRPKTRYELLRSQEEDYCVARWSAGKTVLKWESKNADPATNEDLILDTAFEGAAPWLHTPNMMCRPAQNIRCKLHNKELESLIATSPPVPLIPEDDDQATKQITNTVIDTKETTIRTEFARKGILIVAPREPKVPKEDDDIGRTTVYTTVDAETIGLIELEKKMRSAGPVRSILRQGAQLRVRGYEKLPIPERKEIAKRYLVWFKVNAPDPERAKQMQARIQWHHKRGEKATILRLYGLDNVPKSFYEVDEDPNRYEHHENDMDVHDVWVEAEVNPDLDPVLDTITPADYEVKYHLRGRPILPSNDDAFHRAQVLRNTISSRALHISTGSNTDTKLGSDHDMADTEWDLGIDMNEYEVVEAAWVLELMGL